MLNDESTKKMIDRWHTLMGVEMGHGRNGYHCASCARVFNLPVHSVAYLPFILSCTFSIFKGSLIPFLFLSFPGFSSSLLVLRKACAW